MVQIGTYLCQFAGCGNKEPLACQSLWWKGRHLSCRIPIRKEKGLVNSVPLTFPLHYFPYFYSLSTNSKCVTYCDLVKTINNVRRFIVLFLLLMICSINYSSWISSTVLIFRKFIHWIRFIHYEFDVFVILEALYR